MRLLREGAVDLKPYGKARPRVTRWGTFMPKQYEASREALMLMYGGRIHTDEPLHLSVVAVRRMPKNWSKKRKEAADGSLCLVKPDLDNIVGAVMDAIFGEDNNIVSIDAKKIWGLEHQLQIKVEAYD